jgi:hypothetical protein
VAAAFGASIVFVGWVLNPSGVCPRLVAWVLNPRGVFPRFVAWVPNPCGVVPRIEGVRRIRLVLHGRLTMPRSAQAGQVWRARDRNRQRGIQWLYESDSSESGVHG